MTRRWIFMPCLAAAGLLAGCSTATRWEQPTATPVAAPASASRPAAKPSNASPVVNDPGQPPRSKRGNPAFYEVFGERYYVMASSASYQERGVASWYGKKFHGKPTSSGVPYDMHGMTAAHKSLPLPTRVRVTNLRNGRSVIVTVNDRGPFVDNRLIDMSFAAAKQLDMVTSGTTLVEVEALPFGVSDNPVMASADSAAAPISLPAPVATAQAATGPAVEDSTGVLYLQVGAFGDAGNAERLKSRLQSAGLDGVIIHRDQTEQPALFRVRLGPIVDVAEYDELVRRVGELDIHDPHLVTDLEYSSGSPANSEI